MSKPEEFKFDSRVRDRFLRGRVLSQAELQKHLEELPDLEGQYEVMSDMPQPAVAPPRSEVAEEPLVFDGIRRLQALGEASNPAPAPRRSVARRRLRFNVAAIDRDDVPLPGVELDAEIDLRLHEREVAVVAHLAVDEDLAGLIEHAQRHADRRAAVAEPALAGDRVVAVVEALADRVMRIGGRSERRERGQRQRPY